MTIEKYEKAEENRKERAMAYEAFDTIQDSTDVDCSLASSRFIADSNSFNCIYRANLSKKLQERLLATILEYIEELDKEFEEL